jgi:hypothetical protein
MPDDRKTFKRHVIKALYKKNASKIISLAKISSEADIFIDKLLEFYPHLLDEEVLEMMREGYGEWEM